jgi:hypothetical protein
MGVFFKRIITIAIVFIFLSISYSSLHAHPSPLIPNDEYLDDQWYLQQIGTYEAWETQTGSRNVVVAVLDTGVDLDHPDLRRNIWVNDDEVSNDGIDNDDNGYVDDVNGYDFVHDDASPIPDQDIGFDADAVSHGTFIAGIIGGVGDNEEGIAGINWKVKIMPVRILDNQGIGDSRLATFGVRYAIDNGADVINLSFTGFDRDEDLRDAVRDAYLAGIVVVAAVGNGGIDIDEQQIYPACYGEGEDDDWILGVGSTNENDEKSEFSNYGAVCTDISAPGENIFSTVYQDDDWLGLDQGFYQDGWSGTSVAAPMVAGASALLRAEYPSLTPKEIKIILRLSADPISAGGNAIGKMGSGRLNIEKAMESALTFLGGEVIEAATISLDPSYRIVVAPEQGSPPIVRVFTNSGNEVVAEFNAYDATFEGGVRLAMGDVDGDGAEEIVTVPGLGGSPHVRVFSLDGKLESQFFVFEQSMRSGLFVATGDVNGDGAEEIAVSTDAGGGGRAQVFDYKGTAKANAFLPYGGSAFDDSVRVAIGDVDGDKVGEVIVSRGEGSEPMVRVMKFNGEFVGEFLAYAATYDKGVFVASGDLDGDGDDEIVTGTDNGGGPQVQIFDGEGSWLGTFFAYDKNFRGGVRLSVGKLSSWKGASIITSAGPGGGPHVRIFNGYSKLIGMFFSDDADERGGINSGAW